MLTRDSLSLHPAQRGAAGSTGPVSASWHATSDGGAVWWSGAYLADWPPVKRRLHISKNLAKIHATAEPVEKFGLVMFWSRSRRLDQADFFIIFSDCRSAILADESCWFLQKYLLVIFDCNSQYIKPLLQCTPNMSFKLLSVILSGAHHTNIYQLCVISSPNVIEPDIGSSLNKGPRYLSIITEPITWYTHLLGTVLVRKVSPTGYTMVCAMLPFTVMRSHSLYNVWVNTRVFYPCLKLLIRFLDWISLTNLIIAPFPLGLL